MFKNMEKLGENIYVYKKFLSNKELNEITEELNALDEEQWIISPGREQTLAYASGIETMKYVDDKISNLLIDNLYLGKNKTAVRMMPGNYWEVHTDEYEFKNVKEKSKEYVDGEPYDEEKLVNFVSIVYFSDFNGGQIYYPSQNIEYAPKPGDLIIHGSDELCQHGVKPVITGKRYSHTNIIYELVKVPKSI